ncbi:MAG TPA: hypothetical protein VM009_02665 [Terriglobales bacterium]|nr:hypothetical protein [Terriglobales bacterium]
MCSYARQMGHHGATGYIFYPLADLLNMERESSMPRKSSRKDAAKKSSKTTVRKKTTVVRMPKPVTEVVTEQRVITTKPEVEIRRPATLAHALTQPPVAVVKPKTTVKAIRSRRSVA